MTDTDTEILLEPENPLPDYSIDQLPDTMRATLSGMGWNSLMAVQAKSIPYLLDGRDMIIQSRTGSGKTGAFLIPLLLRLDPSRRHPQTLILVPTRELAGQVYNEFLSISRNTGLSGALVYGGVGYGTQLQALRDGAQVIVGTPGRVLDHIGRRSLNLDRLSVVIFDEADEMLSMGFYPDMREIRRYLPRERSSWMFSATIPYRVQMLAQEFLHHPEFLSLSVGQVTVQTAEHRIYDVPPLEKDLMLMRIIEMENPDSAIIFCNTKQDVEYVATVLGNYGYDADLLSGDLDQKERERAMGRIRRGETRFLVATDVAARGIDISDLSHVIQYDVPKDPDSYVHRAGRTARAGNTGVVITLVANMSERSDLKKISRRYSVDFVELPMPTQEELETRLAERLTVVLDDQFRNARRLERERLKRFISMVKSLSDSEEEVSLLAMVLDGLYHKSFHLGKTESPVAPPHRPEPEQRESRHGVPRNEPPPAPIPSGERDDSGEKKKKKRRRKKKHGAGDPQSAIPSPIEAVPVDVSVSDPETGEDADIGEAVASEHPPADRQPRSEKSTLAEERTRHGKTREGRERSEKKEGSSKPSGSRIEKVLGSGIMSIVEEIEVYDPDQPLGAVAVDEPGTARKSKNPARRTAGGKPATGKTLSSDEGASGKSAASGRATKKGPRTLSGKRKDGE